MPHKHLTFIDRQNIEKFLALKKKKSWIADFLGVDRTTIYREVKRNAIRGKYRAAQAQRKYKKRRKQQGEGRRKIVGPLATRIKKMLHNRWSPKLIQLKLAQEGIAVSHEAIYQFIYRNPELGLSLIFPRTYRHSKQRSRAKHMRIKNKRHIKERPKEALWRKSYGHFEADLINGPVKGSTSSVLVITERRTRFNHIRLLPNKKAKTVFEAMKSCFSLEYLCHRKSVTTDNGTEFINHQLLEKQRKIMCYFTSTQAPWQRGSNENRNGRLRALGLPRGVDFATLDKTYIRKLQNQINNHPMECLGLKTPAQVRNAERRSVAFQT